MTLIQRLPVFLAAAIALLEIATYGGLYFPDTTQFLRSTLGADFVQHEPHFNVIPPAYPLLLDGILTFVPPPARMFVLVLIQQLSVVATTYLVQRSGETIGKPRVGYVAALSTALYVPLGLFAQSAQTETLSTFYTMTAVALLFSGLHHGFSAGEQKPSWRLLLMAGAVSGLAMAQRTVNIAVPMTVLVAIWLGRDVRRLRSTLAYGIGFAAVISAFVGLNYLHYGHASLVDGVGIHQWGRVAQIEKAAPDTPEVRTLYETASALGHDDPFYENAGWNLHAKLSAHGAMDPYAADALLRKAAFQAYAADPVRTAKMTLHSMARMVAIQDTDQDYFWGGLMPGNFEYFEQLAAKSWATQMDVYEKQYARMPGYAGAAGLGDGVHGWIMDACRYGQWMVKGTWSIVAMVVLGLFALFRRNWALIVTTGLPFALLVGAALGDQPFGRYWEIALPLFFLSLALHVHEIAGMVRARRERRDLDLDAGVTEERASPA